MSVRSLSLPKVIPVLLLLGSFLSEAEAMQMRPSKLSVEYVYAPDGMLTGRTVNGQVQRFEYDKRGQLLAVKDSQGNDLERYVYDPAGNILSKTVHGKTTRFTYDAANQITSRTDPDGNVIRYQYDAAGRLVREGNRTYHYGWQDKVEEIRENGKTVARFTCGLDGQLETVTRADGSVEHFYWDGLALIGRGKSTFLNEPYVTGGNPIASDGKAMLNDMLGSTVGIRDVETMTPVTMTAFGESADSEAMYTGKPHVDGLGYAFLFRNYRAELGKWQTADPLGYPDGWNNLAYCNNGVTFDLDIYGAWSFIRWAYTGDGNASDDIYAAAVNGAGCFIYDLNPVISAGISGSAVAGGGPAISTQANYSVVNADISGSTSLSGGIGYDISAGLFLGLTIGGNMQNGTSVSSNLNFSIKGPLGVSIMYDPNGGVSFFINASLGGGASVTTSVTLNYGNDELSSDDYEIFKQALNNSLVDSVNKQTKDYIIRNYLE